MKTYQFTLTERSLQALREFMKRVPLKGDEVPAFNLLNSEISRLKAIDLSDSSSGNPQATP